MNSRRIATVVLGAAFALAVFTPRARASMRDQATRITFTRSVQVPGATLPPGTYWFTLTGVQTGNRDTVEIYNSDWTHVCATVSTEAVERAPNRNGAPVGNGEIVLAQGPSGEPQAVMEWFYPGRMTGHEFLYSSYKENQLKQEAKLMLEITPAA